MDIVFAKFKGTGEKNRLMWYADFGSALGAVAAKKRVPVEKVREQIIAAGGPATAKES